MVKVTANLIFGRSENQAAAYKTRAITPKLKAPPIETRGATQRMSGLANNFPTYNQIGYHSSMTKPKPTSLARPYGNSPERWCKGRMVDFLRVLAGSHCVASAARSVGMSRQSAYRLRARLKGEPFDIAWEAAFQHGYDALHQVALERALHGVEVPVFHLGEQIGTRRHFDERLTVYLLSARNRHGAQRLGRYTVASEFWSERWDQLLARIEAGSATWQREQEETPAQFDQREASEMSMLERRHAPDPLPRGREQS